MRHVFTEVACRDQGACLFQPPSQTSFSDPTIQGQPMRPREQSSTRASYPLAIPGGGGPPGNPGGGIPRPPMPGGGGPPMPGGGGPPRPIPGGGPPMPGGGPIPAIKAR